MDQNSILVQAFDTETTSLRLHLYTFHLRTQQLTEVAIAEPGWTGAAVYLRSVATDLLLEADVRPAPEPEYGTGAVLVRIAAWILGVALAVVGIWGLTRRVRG